MKRLHHDEPVVPIESVQLDAAVELLAREKHEGRSFLRSVALEVVEDLCVGAVLFGLVVGMIVVWSQLWLGLGLILGALGALLLFGALPQSGLDEASKTLRGAIEESHVLGQSVDQWRGRRASLVTGAVVALGPAVALAGIIWLIWAQITTGTVPGAAIALVAAPTFAYWVWFAYDNVSEFVYFKRVSDVLESISRQAADEGGRASVSPSALDILSRAETHQVQRTVAEAVGQLPDVLEGSYAVSLADEPAQYLERLAFECPRDWARITETLHALQADPRPRRARPAAEVPQTAEVVAGPHGVEYVVDDEVKRVYVLAIDDEHPLREEGSR